MERLEIISISHCVSFFMLENLIIFCLFVRRYNDNLTLVWDYCIISKWFLQTFKSRINRRLLRFLSSKCKYLESLLLNNTFIEESINKRNYGEQFETISISHYDSSYTFYIQKSYNFLFVRAKVYYAIWLAAMSVVCWTHWEFSNLRGVQTARLTLNH